MTELTYALTVEALIFALGNTHLVAQRWNVFEWPAERTWPVFGTLLLVLLAYAQFLLIIACFIQIAGLSKLSSEVREGMARAVGRLVTVSVLLIVYMSAVVWSSSREHWAIILCQFWGTQCVQPGSSQLWSYSYSYYLVILLPCLAVQAALLLKAASGCKSSSYSPRRIITANIAFVLLLHCVYTLNSNFTLGCTGTCLKVNNSTIFDAQPGIVYVRSPKILFLGLFFFALDIAADVCAGLALGHSVPAVVIFSVARGLQMAD